MPLLRASQLTHHIAEQVILDSVAIVLQERERVCLLGRNGAGKTTLLRILEKSLQADSGEVWHRPGLSIARMEQTLPVENSSDSVYDAVAGGLAETGALLRRYHHVAIGNADRESLTELESLQNQIESVDGWRYQQKIESMLSALALPADTPLSELSGGWRRRVSLARALVAEPDLLLLDEPTNHLDMAAIEWLERCVLDYSGAVLFISHDRRLIDTLATRIIELDRGRLTSYDGNLQRYNEQREHNLRVEAEHNALFDKRLAQEERWIRQGIKARRTRNEGRVRALEQMRRERAQRLEVQGRARMDINTASSGGKRVAELQDVNYSVAGNTLVRDFSLVICRGDKLGLIGPNGVGKTTLLRLILGEIAPDNGVVNISVGLKAAYFDQMRDGMDEALTVADIVGEGRESVNINGRERHIMSYLGDFLFTPERARSQLRVLSGGERARVQLARLFSQLANVVVMDEPTNDLDIETLELLEELLGNYPGTVLLVSHDREFVDNVVTGTLLFEGDGKIVEHAGGYSDTVARHSQSSPEKALEQVTVSESVVRSAPPREGGAGKLSYKLQRELDGLPKEIESLESAIAALEHKVSDPAFYQQEHQQIADTLEALASRQTLLEQCYERWLELTES